MGGDQEQNNDGVDSESTGYANFEGETAERSGTGMAISEDEDDGKNDKDEDEDKCEREDYPRQRGENACTSPT